MKEILDGVPVTDWQRPANIVNASVVVAPGDFGGYGSGLVPSNLSPFSSQEIFVRGTQPARTDDWFSAGCPQPDGSVKLSMKVQDARAPAAWQRYTDQWVRDAIAGRHTYGRYTWNLVSSDPCPTLAPVLTPVPTRTPGTSPTVTFPPVTLPPFPTTPVPVPTPTKKP
jgi:hypothetical protein